MRWTIRDFFTHVQDKDILESDEFALNGSNVKFYLSIDVSDDSAYYLALYDIAGEEQIEIIHKFWLENSKGEKCAETFCEFY